MHSTIYALYLYCIKPVSRQSLDLGKKIKISIISKNVLEIVENYKLSLSDNSNTYTTFIIVRTKKYQSSSWQFTLVL
jgi:hypothetical protein